ncbi:MAG: rRNA maturation RNase YbeY [Clostridia bacterium]|nr:rRNA maturation RNase YbeY [Clostridia bacterium]
MKVNFSNFGLFHKSSIKKAFQIVLEKTALDFECFYANVKFVSEEEIRDLNSTFRNIDKITDVLSFPNLELKKGKEFDIKQLKKEINEENGLISLGDIAICKSVAKTQAENYNHSFKREVLFLALHGFLHLLGFDHENPEDEKEMFSLQKDILKKCGIKR